MHDFPLRPLSSGSDWSSISVKNDLRSIGFSKNHVTYVVHIELLSEKKWTSILVESLVIRLISVMYSYRLLISNVTIICSSHHEKSVVCIKSLLNSRILLK